MEDFKEKDVGNIKTGMASILEKMSLHKTVSLGEVEDHISKHKRVYDSPLLLGILARAIETKKGELIEEIIPLCTHWKNFIPQDELGGLSPVQYERQYPRGENEVKLMEEMLETLSFGLEKEPPHKNPEALEKKLIEIQKKFLSLIPLNQPFSTNEKLLTNKEIIMEERRRNGHPNKSMARIGLTLFAEDVSFTIEDKLKQFDKTYEKAVNDLIDVQDKPTRLNFSKIESALKNFRSLEPYMKCRMDSFRFYLNYGNTAFLADDLELAISLYERAVSINPKYKEARETLDRIRKFLKENG
ncbi:MAG: hypothetical protein Q8P52_00200 [bacterium]|nr:hypothetical protein [bacterium]